MWAGAAMALSSCSVVLSSLFLTRFKCLSVNEIEKKIDNTKTKPNQSTKV